MDKEQQEFWRAVLRVPENETVESWIRDHSEVLPNGNMVLPVSGILRLS